MTELELEQAADHLLRDSIQALGRGDYPWYSQAWLRELTERAAIWPPDFPEAPEFLPTVCLRLLAQTPMPPEARAALRLSIHGHTIRELAAQLNISPSTAWRRVRQATALLAAAATDLDELYTPKEAIRLVHHEETSRHKPTRERHCKPRHEACRKTGTCPFRWYLNKI